MTKMTYKRWYIRLIFRHPPPRKGIARVSQVSKIVAEMWQIVHLWRSFFIIILI